MLHDCLRHKVNKSMQATYKAGYKLEVGLIPIATESLDTAAVENK
uniref:Uncharacterized protein n=1 Tax=Anguilla anguilla TaxID=7936 RepID=A0A0E9RZS8_ANGAN